MLSKADIYRQTIQKATKKIMLFSNVDNQEKKSTVKFECNIKLPSLYPFRSSQQIQNNVPIIHHITHQSSKYYPTQINNEWPKSCIGLLLCEHHQNNRTFYVYGIGTLIHSNIVLTSARNLYCRRSNTQYTSIRFISGISGDKCSGIYDVKRVHYPKEYTMQEGYDDYNFAILQLYDDLSNCYGYVGWKTAYKPASKKLITFGYINEKQKGWFSLREGTKHKQLQPNWRGSSGSGLLVKDRESKWSIVGLEYSLERERFIVFSEKIRNMINQWTYLTRISMISNNIGVQECKYLRQGNQTHFIQIILSYNRIGAQGCKYLSQADWTHITQINLTQNGISAQGCKYLSQANWIHLTHIDLRNNKIGAQGCKYLSKANWTYLNKINLRYNNIGAQGCKYLTQTNWTHLTEIILQGNNNIGAQGCKYLSQANWTHLTNIELRYNNIGAQGCKYLSQTNWHLTKMNLRNNNILDTFQCLLLLQLYPNNAIKI